MKLGGGLFRKDRNWILGTSLESWLPDLTWRNLKGWQWRSPGPGKPFPRSDFSSVSRDHQLSVPPNLNPIHLDYREICQDYWCQGKGPMRFKMCFFWLIVGIQFLMLQEYSNPNRVVSRAPWYVAVPPESFVATSFLSNFGLQTAAQWETEESGSC